MADDYYKTLGLSRDATPEQIQKAYRDLARKHHPDLHPDDKTAKEKFQKVQAAFEVLNDPKKKEMYDRYGAAYEQFGGGQAGAGPRTWRTTTGGGPGGASFEGVDLGDIFGEGGVDPSSIFGDIFGQFNRGGGGATGGRRRTRSRSTAPPAGADVHQEIEIPFQTAVQGGKVELRLQREDGAGETISVKIPKGVAEGKTIRLRGKGASAGGAAGDLLLKVKIAPHPFYQRRGNNLEVRVPVTLAEATQGAKVDVPTPTGTIALRLPPMTSSGRKLRVKGHGVETSDGQKGDLLADIQIVLPPKLDEETLRAIERTAGQYGANPREDLQW